LERCNLGKCRKHGVPIEAVESLFSSPIAILPDDAHSRKEQRLRAVGWTEEGRAVFVVFTLRRRGSAVLIRPISTRYMHEKEMKAYEKENPEL
jgi:uncharacterized DUF497 family protein